MREFKFRAWENNKMYYQVRTGGMFDGIPTAPTVWNEEVGDWLNLTGQPHTIVMQYAGLKDYFGAEIYEGDILQTVKWHDESQFTGDIKWLVKYDEEKLTYYKINQYGSKDTLYDIHLTGVKWKVRGNVYENPELVVL